MTGTVIVLELALDEIANLEPMISSDSDFRRLVEWEVKLKIKNS